MAPESDGDPQALHLPGVMEASPCAAHAWVSVPPSHFCCNVRATMGHAGIKGHAVVHNTSWTHAGRDISYPFQVSQKSLFISFSPL